jgi:hypothetical protein
MNTNDELKNETANGTKPVLSAVLSDAEYIQELEGLVCFLARCYEKTLEVYHDTHLKTCSVANPERRELTDCEKSEYRRFPLIQGFRLQRIISDISKANKPNPINIQALVSRFLA